ncbi:protein translocase subunit SecD [bacterium]|nr:protein translocase subunit SecD [bacterium]MBT4928057.1 protein translocase subunit SecD [bacterium]MBT6777053.1 protein translocase subunit SecD [bacterium]
MKNSLTPRYLVILVLLGWSFYSLWPSIKYQGLDADEKELLREQGELAQIESRIIRQGLDLKGGMYILLETDIPALVKSLASNRNEKFDNLIEEITNEFRLNSGENFFNIFREKISNSDIKVVRYYHEYGSNLEDIIAAIEDETEDSINRVLEILQNRIDQFGVSEPTIQKQGKYRILVELAGIQDSDRARALLQSTALLEFYLVKNNASTNEIISQLDNILKKSVSEEELEILISESKLDKKPTEATKQSKNNVTTVDEIFGETTNSRSDSLGGESDLSFDSPLQSLIEFVQGDLVVKSKNVYALKKLLSQEAAKLKLKSSSGQFIFGNDSESLGASGEYFRLYYLETVPELTGGVVEKAKASLGSLGGGSAGLPVVSLDMNSEGSKTWSRVTGANIGQRIAIVLDNKVHMAPNIREKIPGGRTQIEGFADINEAKDIAIILRAGALPAPVNIIEERTVGPSLGADSIARGQKSILIGLGVVFIFMLIYYRAAGAIANFALIWNIVLILAVLASLGATLTLPGIAGLILTVGMCIDSNVIIFERIREELRKGKTPKSAIEAGYNRAITTIIDANLTTVIASLVLYQFGTGPIKGFATVLFWGILISMFTAIYVTRTIFYTITKKSIKTLSI